MEVLEVKQLQLAQECARQVRTVQLGRRVALRVLQGPTVLPVPQVAQAARLEHTVLLEPVLVPIVLLERTVRQVPVVVVAVRQVRIV